MPIPLGVGRSNKSEFRHKKEYLILLQYIFLMSKLTTAFLGVAHIHTPSFINHLNTRTEDIRVKSVYDANSARGTKRAAELAGAVYTANPASIFEDPEITSVVICAETNLHRDLVISAAKSGKNIFCEKPIGIASEDAIAMAAAVNEAGVIFQTGFFMRGSGANQFIRREVMAGRLGKITRAHYSSCHQAALAGWFDTEWRWLTDKSAAGGGAMLDMGAHPLDLILNTFTATEGEIVRVASSLGNRGGRYGTQIDEYGTALLTFSSGATAIIEASWVDPALKSPTLVYGTEGQIQVKDGQLYYYSEHVEGADGKAPITDLPKDAPHAFHMFWNKLLGEELPIDLVSVDEAKLGSITMERIYNAH
jgi:predicted dehydrogenase